MQDIVEAIDGITSSPTAPDPTFVRRDRESLTGIKCGDVLDSGKRNLTGMTSFFNERMQSSRYFGDAQMTPARCAQWKLPAKERYDGDFKVRTKTGVMVINNSYDPITPLSSARNLTSLLEGSFTTPRRCLRGRSNLSSLYEPTANPNISTLPKPNSQFVLLKLFKSISTRVFFLGQMLNELSTFPPFSKKTGWEEVMDETKAVGDKTTSQEAKVMESRCQLYIFGHCILDRQSFGCFRVA